MSNGYILWEGRSELDGGPIVVIATGFVNKSNNSKTGGLIQTYILHRDLPPFAAIQRGADKSICGDCRHRGDGTGKERSCYVTIMHGPRGVWEAYKRGSYEKMTNLHDIVERFEDRVVRLGAYGDPAAAPLALWDAVTKRAKSFTGYTHQWRTCHDGFAAFCMASVDSVYEASEAQLAGYRTFRVRQVGGDVLRNEIICPASVEAGKRTTCENCILCAGNKTRSVKNIVIIAHGTGRKHVT